MPVVLLFLLAILAEWLLRCGLWDDYVEPYSYLGNAIYRDKAINAFGLDNIEWITVGDSKIDWGIDHEKLFKISEYNGVNHIRMSFEGSDFMAIQAVIEWSLENMPNLKGIMLGVSENNFGHFNDINKQHKILGRLISHKNNDRYTYVAEGLNIAGFMNLFYVYKYFSDFKDFLKNSRKRIKTINYYLDRHHKNIFTYNRSHLGNICRFKLNTLQQCVDEVDQIHELGTEEEFANKVVLVACDNENARNRAIHDLPVWPLTDQKLKLLQNNWHELFDTVLSHRVKLKLVLLPEHSIMNYSIKPSNTLDVLNEVLGDIIENINVEVLDLRRIFDSNDLQQECEYYYEPFHYNNKGKILITEHVINSFKFINTTEIKEDLINHFDF